MYLAVINQETVFAILSNSLSVIRIVQKPHMVLEPRQMLMAKNPRLSQSLNVWAKNRTEPCQTQKQNKQYMTQFRLGPHLNPFYELPIP